MKSIDEKFAGRDEFALIGEMSRLTGKEAPAAVKDLENKPVLHTTVCGREEMKKHVERILGLS